MTETTVAPKANPALSVGAPAAGIVGSAVPASAISATLAGGSAASGTVSFTVFGPQTSPPGSCTSGGTLAGSANVAGDGTYHPSGAFTPTTPGDYWWYATYSGDPSNEPATSSCDTPMTETTVDASKPLAPTISSVKLGSKTFATKQTVTLKLTVSQPATIEIRIDETVAGHIRGRACKPRAEAGRRCVTMAWRRTLRFRALPGSHTFKLKFARLGKGRYTATIIAENANGESDAVRLHFDIARNSPEPTA
jgi:hypothetical protein